ncbi:MAG: sugar kinase [Anaerolineae bacterium]|jgi:2-dehydro-3-deoxygluconokinase|nr:sugar kinase [Anaerolineae bacterium]
MPRYDVVTLGEGMIRLTPPQQQRLEQAQELRLHVGGSEMNTAVGLARLGLRTAWLSRLTRNPLGERIAFTLRGHGVDVSQVCWTDADRIGLYFVEEGPVPRGSQVLYDRQQSAMSRMQPQELPADLFTPDGARLLHVTGITAALSQSAAATVTQALTLAKAAGWRISFDINYRARLWSPAEALAVCQPLLQQADVIFAPVRDVVLLFQPAAPLSAELAAELLAARYPGAAIVLTMGGDGALVRDPAGGLWRQPAFTADTVDRIGGGDAFDAGFLYGYLSTAQPERVWTTALRYGAAAAALKYTLPGDLPLIHLDDVERLLAQPEAGSIRR